MDQAQTFQQFLVNQNAPVSAGGFLFNLILAAGLAFILQWLYVHYGVSLINRRRFAHNFMLLTLTTMLVIAIVKSSLALSLGLVGALSIVRFRSAIKEPEELAFLFLSIAIGLGLGANQRLITILAFVFIGGLIVVNKAYHTPRSASNLFLTVTCPRPPKTLFKQMLEVLKIQAAMVDLKRYDENAAVMEATFLVEFNSIDQFDTAKLALQALNPEVQVTFLDHKGMV